jgi:hypothetical protein
MCRTAEVSQRNDPVRARAARVSRLKNSLDERAAGVSPRKGSVCGRVEGVPPSKNPVAARAARVSRRKILLRARAASVSTPRKGVGIAPRPPARRSRTPCTTVSDPLHDGLGPPARWSQTLAVGSRTLAVGSRTLAVGSRTRFGDGFDPRRARSDRVRGVAAMCSVRAVHGRVACATLAGGDQGDARRAERP